MCSSNIADELVPICKVVTEPPNEISAPSIVIPSFAKLAFAIAVPFHTPVVIVPNVVIELAPKNPVLSASCNTTCAEPDTVPAGVAAVTSTFPPLFKIYNFLSSVSKNGIPST